MANEVTKQENNIISGDAFDFNAFSGTGVSGIDVNQSDMKLPKYKLLQATSLEVSKSGGKLHAGQFYNTVTGEAVDEIEAVLLDQGKSMVMWNEKFKRGEEPICRSFDGKVKAEGCGDGNCETCQYSSQNSKAWEEAKKQNKNKPGCSMSYVFICLDVRTNTPFRLIVSGASVGNGKAFINKLVPLMEKHNMPIYATKCKFSSHQEENDQGTYYVVDIAGPMPNNTALNVDGTRNENVWEQLKKNATVYKKLFMTSIVQNDVVDVDVQPVEEEGESGGLF